MATQPQKRSEKRTAPAKPSKRLPAAAAESKVAAPEPGKPEIRLFVSYSHADAGAQEKLKTHLAVLARDGVSAWFDGDLNAGDELDAGIARALRRAHIFVALLSPEYLASQYCWNIEYRRAMNRRTRGTMRVVAVIVRPCDWKATRAARFKLLPRDGRPVTRWRSADEAYVDVVEGIRAVVKALRKEISTPSNRPRRVSSPAKLAARKVVAARSRAGRPKGPTRSPSKVKP